MARVPAPELIAALAGRGVPMAAASSSPRRIVDANIAAVGAGAHLAAWLAREDGREGKRRPTSISRRPGASAARGPTCLVVDGHIDGRCRRQGRRHDGDRLAPRDDRVDGFSQADCVVDDLAAFDWSWRWVRTVLCMVIFTL